MAKDVPVIRYNSDESEKGGIKAKWWMEAEGERHKHIFGVVKGIREKQAYRTRNNLLYARLYGNMELEGLQAGSFAKEVGLNAGKTRQTLNLIKAAVDTVSAKIGSRKTRPLFMTEDGNWSLQRRAELLTRYMEGAFDVMGTGTGDNRTLYGVGRRGFTDACVLGTGGIKFYADPDAKAVKCERVLVEEIVVDETEGRYEDPRQLHQEKLVHREVLLDLYPKFADKIGHCESGLEKASDSSADMLKVIESWHLPSGSKAKDGVKVISIANCDLDTAEWKLDRFPFLFHRWSPRLLGFYGMGIAEELMPIQLEINKLLRNIRQAQHLMSVPQVWLEMQNKVNGNSLRNEFGGTNYYLGQPPIFMVPQAMSPEVYQHLERLWMRGFEQVGVSQWSATGKKPAGLDAGVAMREYQDVESERFQDTALRCQDFYIEAAYLTMDLMEELGNPKVRAKTDYGIKEISWEDAQIDRDKLRIRAFPTDLLPATPVGKWQNVQEMMQAGFLDKEESLELLDFPDLKHVVSLKTAARKDLRRMIEVMVEHGVYESPEPYMALEYGRNLAQSYYLKGRTEGMPEDRLELLRRFMDDCAALLQPPAQAAPADPMAAPSPEQAAMAQAETMQPMATPEAQPTSDLLPVA